MKSIFLLVLAILFLINDCAAQDTPVPSKDSYQYLMKKRRTFKTLGWVSVGTGATLILVGAAAATGELLSGSSKNNSEVIADIGLVAALASVPLFIMSHSYKKKAQLALKNEQSFLKPWKGMRYPALAFQIKL